MSKYSYYSDEVISLRKQKAAQLISHLTLQSQLPIAARRDEIIEVIAKNQVVIITGETGSGKTTQLPKILLEMGRGVTKLIGHTQPRRISAKVIAQRLADETGVEVGSEIGYHVRFDSRFSDNTLVKIMTDGILLSEIKSDRLFDRYDTLIIDEAHERSLNIDFILGYLSKILPLRPDLKVVITSATIDSERFSQHFNAPILNVSGRNYEVEIRYRPFLAAANDHRSNNPRYEASSPGGSNDFLDTATDLPTAIISSLKDLLIFPKGDVLVFLPGERDIRDITTAIRSSDITDIEVIPLYSRLSTAEQHKVFMPHKLRRVILATNIAEASLTLPDIKYVVDSGLARISRFNYRTKVQRLPIEAISKASADQRAGRCGRTSNGVCLRLYSQEDYDNRPQYTEPEILRTNLASVLLHMAAAELGDIKHFPFIDPPDARAVREGENLLLELGALENSGQTTIITELGRSLLDFPLDPRLARVILKAIELNCLYAVIIIVSFLSIQDPREVPTEEADKATHCHSRFVHPKSDFMSVLKLWEHLSAFQKELSSNQFRKKCRSEFLNILRIREWQDIVSQITQICRMKRIHVDHNYMIEYDAVHIAILTGFISHIGNYDIKRKMYKGAKSSSFYIARSSAIFSKKPKWIVAANLVETSRVFAYMAAEINPSWLLSIAKDQLQYRYSSHWWDPSRAEAMMKETITLYGLALFQERTVGLRKANPSLARSQFIENGLCKQNWETDISAVHEMWNILNENDFTLQESHHFAGISFDEEKLAEFYDKLIPDYIASGIQFRDWYRKKNIDQKKYLQVNCKKFIEKYYKDAEESGFPKYISVRNHKFPVIYPGENGNLSQSAIIKINLESLLDLDDSVFSYSVPGYRPQIITRILKSLPKEIRKNLPPLETVVTRIAEAINKYTDDYSETRSVPMTDLVGKYLSREYGIDSEAPKTENIALPDYLQFTFFIYSNDVLLAIGKSILELQDELRLEIRSYLNADISRTLNPADTNTWIWDHFPEITPTQYGMGYPTLLPKPNSVSVAIVESSTIQKQAMAYGIRKLLDLEISISNKVTDKLLTGNIKKTLGKYQYSPKEFFEDIKVALIDYVVSDYKSNLLSKDDYGYLLRYTIDTTLKSYIQFFYEVVEVMQMGLSVIARIEDFEQRTGPKLSTSIADIKSVLDSLLHKHFILCAGYKDIKHFTRYLSALNKRIEALTTDPYRDVSRMNQMSEVTDEYLSAVTAVSDGIEPKWPLCKNAHLSLDDDITDSILGFDNRYPDGKGSSFILPVSGKDLKSMERLNFICNSDNCFQLVHLFGRGTLPDGLQAFWKVRFLLEELRVSLWAQELGTSQKISRERVSREIGLCTIRKY